MTNREIRALAMKRRKDTRFAWIIFLWFVLNAALVAPVYFTGSLGAGAELALDALIGVVAALVASTGLARASVAEWSGRGARLSDLFASLTSGRLFLRGLAIAVLSRLPMEVLWLIQTATDSVSADDPSALGISLLTLAGSILIFIASVCVNTLFYAAEIAPEENLRALIPRSLGRALRNFWRFVGMAIVTGWVPVLLFFCYGIFAFMFIIQLESALTYALLIGGFVALLIATVRVYGAYVALSYAGVAAEVFGGAGEGEGA